MVLKVAVQMDPLESINIAGDSSFALMMAAQARGHEIWHYDVASLAYESDGTPRGRITAHAAPVTVQRVQGEHFTAGERRRIDLAHDIDVVLMRQDPPFHLGYISAALLLDRNAHLLERLRCRVAAFLPFLVCHCLSLSAQPSIAANFQRTGQFLADRTIPAHLQPQLGRAPPQHGFELRIAVQRPSQAVHLLGRALRAGTIAAARELGPLARHTLPV